MAFHFFDFLRKQDGTAETVEVTVKELLEASEDLKIRKMCFQICVNLIANAIGRCEFRTYREFEEIQEDEYYLWNVEPNANQNSTMFLHKLATKICEDNETLIVTVGTRNHQEMLAVADSFDRPKLYPVKQNEYKNVRIGELTYDKTFRENDVIHLQLNHLNLTSVVDEISKSFSRLYERAVRAYEYAQGQHWKVHVSQIQQNQAGWLDAFQKMITEQVKPFLESSGAVLPEFDGYNYENMGAAPGKNAVDTRDIRKLVDDVFEFTARQFQIPMVMIGGQVEATADANSRFLTNCIDPLADQIQEEINRKRYGLDGWKRGDYLRVDTSSIQHFDLFAAATAIEKLLGTGYSPNEIRRAANQGAINEPWADTHYITKNIGQVGEAEQGNITQEGGNS